VPLKVIRAEDCGTFICIIYTFNGLVRYRKCEEQRVAAAISGELEHPLRLTVPSLPTQARMKKLSGSF
jgi:hypothetical protein